MWTQKRMQIAFHTTFLCILFTCLAHKYSVHDVTNTVYYHHLTAGTIHPTITPATNTNEMYAVWYHTLGNKRFGNKNPLAEWKYSHSRSTENAHTEEKKAARKQEWRRS